MEVKSVVGDGSSLGAKDYITDTEKGGNHPGGRYLSIVIDCISICARAWKCCQVNERIAQDGGPSREPESLPRVAHGAGGYDVRSRLRV